MRKLLIGGIRAISLSILVLSAPVVWSVEPEDGIIDDALVLEAFDKTEAFSLALVEHRSQLVAALSNAKNRLQGNRELINHGALKETHEIAKSAYTDLTKSYAAIGFVMFGKKDELKRPVSVKLLKLKDRWKGHSPPETNYFKFEGFKSGKEVNDPVLAEKFVLDHLQQLERAASYSYFLMLQLVHEHGPADAGLASQLALRASLVNSLDYTLRVYTTIGLMAVTKKPVGSSDRWKAHQNMGSAFSALDLILVHANSDKTPAALKEKLNQVKNITYDYFGQWSFDMAVYYRPPCAEGGRTKTYNLTLDEWLGGAKNIYDTHAGALNLVSAF